MSIGKGINILQYMENENDHLWTILNIIKEGIHMIDENGKTLIYNNAMERIEQMDKKTVINKHVLDLYRLNENTSYFMKVLKTGVPIVNQYQQYITVSGKEINIIADVYPIFKESRIAGCVAVINDVSAIKKISDILYKKNIYNKNSGGTQYSFQDIIGCSQSLKNNIAIAKKASLGFSSVMIYGETGTGKELFAQSIHNFGKYSAGPFVAVNCGAIPETLLEGILFGTTRGAFTGAIDKPGIFEQASGGTLFLDEINSLSPSLQAKLLRVLQTKTLRRVGDNKEISINARVVSAINIDPIEALENNILRRDLYYRLAVVMIHILPLRERVEDILPLCMCFVDKYNHALNKNVQSISKKVMDMFHKYRWPGNIRELENAIEYAFNLELIRK